jgi:hypothetical protein
MQTLLNWLTNPAPPSVWLFMSPAIVVAVFFIAMTF